MIINISGKNCYVVAVVDNLRSQLKQNRLSCTAHWSGGKYANSYGECSIQTDADARFLQSFNNDKVRVEIVEETFDSILRYVSSYGSEDFEFNITMKSRVYDMDEFEDCESYEIRMREMGGLLC